MTRPEIIRADSIDLQDHQAPSAKEHPRSKQPPTTGNIAPHQAETLREVKEESAEENLRSPRVSWTNGNPGDLQQYTDDLSAGVTNSLASGQAQNQRGGANANNMAATGQQQDALAIAQNGGIPSHDAEDGAMNSDGDEDADDGMDDDMMDKISSSPSIEDEDIDFEFVYALHTFVATVEGQANATKGDTMVLLDDSNSYWWLVRVVKDSSIGYLPAEHIETPTERLARLNKHRNVDLSATMLGDQAEKSRNPLKTAMKRRKAKNVQFAGNTYIDYSDFDYSSDEEEAEAEYFARTQREQQAQQQKEQAKQAAATQASKETDAQDETAKVEPLRTKSKDAKPESKRQDSTGDAELSSTVVKSSRSSEELFETKSGDGPKKTSDGTVRDSFFKDDTVETKKITLTPNLLRDDSATRSSGDSKEVRQRPSLDKVDKDSILSKDDKKKKDKKEKDKKTSGLRGLFSRKDKKTKGDDETDSVGKRSLDSDLLQEKEVEEDEMQASPERQQMSQQGKSGKLQKAMPRTEPSPTRKPGTATKGPGVDLATFLSEDKVNNVANVPPATMRVVDPEIHESSSQGVASQKESSVSRSAEPSRKEDNSGTAASNAYTRALNGGMGKSKPTSRAEYDGFDSLDEDEETAPEPVRQAPVPEEKLRPPQRPIPGAFPDSYQSAQSAATAAPSSTSAPTDTANVPVANSTPSQQHVERLSESPVQVSPVNSNNPPALMGDSSSQEDPSISPRSTPELIEHEDTTETRQGTKDSIMTSSTSTMTTMSSWNDASLRAFFDSGSEIRDLLMVVYDKNDAESVEEHPVTSSLFREQNARLAEITTQLDNMLGDWLARKQRLRGAV